MVDSSQFLGNTAGGGDGGGGVLAEGIFLNAVGSGVFVTVQNGSVISGNRLVGTTGDGGGGIGSEGAVTVTDSSVDHNTSITEGGGIASVESVTLTRATIADNQTTAGDSGGFDSGAGAIVTASTISGWT